MTGQINSSTIKHTVEFSKIRRTRVPDLCGPAFSGQLVKPSEAVGGAPNRRRFHPLSAGAGRPIRVILRPAASWRPGEH